MSRYLSLARAVTGFLQKNSLSRASQRHFPGFLILICFIAFSAPAAPAAEKLVICYANESFALVPLAKLRDFYAAEGIEIEMRRVSNGLAALDAMFDDKCAVATSTEVPTVHHSLYRQDFRILAVISETSDFDKVIVRNGRGILNPAGLRGSRIAVPQFTSAHLFLDALLAANGLASRDVVKIFLPAAEALASFRRGEVDAVSHWEPDIQVLARELGDGGKVLGAPGLHVAPYLLVGKLAFVRENPAVIERLLRALLRAERFLKEQPATAKMLIAQHFATKPNDIELIWRLHSFRVSLGQTLPLILENAARWELNQMPPTRRPAMPDYLDFIHVHGLRTVKPAVVTLVH